MVFSDLPQGIWELLRFGKVFLGPAQLQAMIPSREGRAGHLQSPEAEAASVQLIFKPPTDLSFVKGISSNPCGDVPVTEKGPGELCM